MQTPFLQRLRNCEARKNVVKIVGCRETKGLSDSVQFATIGWTFGTSEAVCFRGFSTLPRSHRRFRALHNLHLRYLYLMLVNSRKFSLHTLCKKELLKLQPFISSTQNSKLRTWKIHHDLGYSEHGTLQVAGQFTVAKPCAKVSFWCALVYNKRAEFGDLTRGSQVEISLTR